MFLGVLSLLFFSFPSIQCACYHEHRVALFKCFGKRLRADVAVDVYNGGESEENVKRMNARCEEFITCMQPPTECTIAGYDQVRDWCVHYMFRGRVFQCFNKLVSKNENDNQTKLTNAFAACMEAGKQQNKSECTMVKECTEKIITDECHVSVVPEVTKHFGNVFYEPADCQEEGVEGSGSQ